MKRLSRAIVLAAAFLLACGRGEPAPVTGVTVVVRGERIAAIGEDIDVPGGSEVIDGRGSISSPAFGICTSISRGSTLSRTP